MIGLNVWRFCFVEAGVSVAGVLVWAIATQPASCAAASTGYLASVGYVHPGSGQAIPAILCGCESVSILKLTTV